MDTLFGHQADVLGVDARRAERVLTVGADHTCRVWKIPEESQLIYRCLINRCHSRPPTFLSTCSAR